METGAIVITVAGVGATRSISYRAQPNQLIQSHLQYRRWHAACFGMRPEALYRPLWESSSRAEGAAGPAAAIKFRDRGDIEYRDSSHASARSPVCLTTATRP